MRAILVSVDYDDLLALTLPYNRRHFETVTVVTSPTNAESVTAICQQHRANVVVTDLFYAKGAIFNKWAALEYGLDRIGRKGWIALLDADVLWPKDVRIKDGVADWEEGTYRVALSQIQIGYLYTPRRRMFPGIPYEIPDEHTWQNYPLHRNEIEFAGYSQIFHCDDPVLGPPPWHETNWIHAGGADSFFQRKWPNDRKVRPPFEVLHLGEAGVNWCGRATPYADGTLPVGAEERRSTLRQMISNRRLYGPWRTNSDRYAGEKLSE